MNKDFKETLKTCGKCIYFDKQTSEEGEIIAFCEKYNAAKEKENWKSRLGICVEEKGKETVDLQRAFTDTTFMIVGGWLRQGATIKWIAKQLLLDEEHIAKTIAMEPEKLRNLSIPKTVTNEVFQDLANAIIVQAAADYKDILEGKEDKKLPSKRSIEVFFGSQWCESLTSLDPKAIIAALRKDEKCKKKKAK